MAEVWLRSNRRILALGLVPGLVISGASLSLLLSTVGPWIWWIALVAMAIGLLLIFVVAKQLLRPRVGYADHRRGHGCAPCACALGQGGEVTRQAVGFSAIVLASLAWVLVLIGAVACSALRAADVPPASPAQVATDARRASVNACKAYHAAVAGGVAPADARADATCAVVEAVCPE